MSSESDSTSLSSPSSVRPCVDATTQAFQGLVTDPLELATTCLLTKGKAKAHCWAEARPASHAHVASQRPGPEGGPFAFCVPLGRPAWSVQDGRRTYSLQPGGTMAGHATRAGLSPSRQKLQALAWRPRPGRTQPCRLAQLVLTPPRVRRTSGPSKGQTLGGGTLLSSCCLLLRPQCSLSSGRGSPEGRRRLSPGSQHTAGLQKWTEV